MQKLLDAFLKRFIAEGSLRVRWPDGQTTSYTGHMPGPDGAMAISDEPTVRRLVFNPAMEIGEGYMNGTIQPLDGTIYDLLDVLATNLEGHSRLPGALGLHYKLAKLRRLVDQYNPASRSRRNVAHHYDLNGRLYSLFLDRDRQYSCAYFATGDETLEEAQEAKKRHLAAKLRLDRPDLSVLDIGSGWGGLGLTLARDWGASVHGVTLSHEQLAESRARAEAEGLQARANFELRDYRSVEATYDRIVSVGMFEHVGLIHFPAFFSLVKRALKPDGIAVLHAIGRADGPGATNPWIAKYIFPGGYSPALSEVLPAIERAGLIVTDIEILHLHYARTLHCWRHRFAANRDAIAALYDARFCRMFEFYLAGSELAFRRQNHMVFQIQLAHRATAVPWTRDYITDADRQGPPRALASQPQAQEVAAQSAVVNGSGT